MAWDSVPWFIGGGAQHSPEVARLLAYAATGGSEGVVAPSDLKVTALPVPGASVRVAPGAALIRNRATGGDSQTYVARLPIQDTVGVASTGAGAGRSDLVVAQIEDPFMAGEPWQTPADPKVGPYIHTRIIPNVPAGTTRLQDVPGYAGRSAITLARIDFPASTGTVTAAMIKDLRTVSNPRTGSLIRSGTPTAAGLSFTSTAPGVWPVLPVSIDIPDWAGRVDIIGYVRGISQSGASVATEHRLRLGSGAAVLTSPMALIDEESTVWSRREVMLTLSDTVPAAMRGTSQPLAVLSGRIVSEGNGVLQSHHDTQLIFDVRFTEAAV